MLANKILAELRRVFDLVHIELENESHKHNVPPGSESHFKLVLVSQEFESKRLVQRHQLVYGALAELMPQFHALAMHLYTPLEWDQRQQVAPNSPKCHGGEKGSRA
jgi:BolA protein